MNIHQHLYDAIFFSPHLDDAVLSAGALIAELTHHQKRVLVVTAFTRASNNSFTGDAQTFLTNSGGYTAEELFAKRQQEDVHAVQKLGATHLHLANVDALFRTTPQMTHAASRQLYPTFKSVFSAQMHAQDTPLLRSLTHEVTTLHRQLKNGGKFYAPLGIGGHIDHLLCYEAVQPLPPHDLVFWEDVPYRIEHQKTLSRMHVIGLQRSLWKNVRTPHFSDEAVRKKTHAVCAYKTQITGLQATGLSDAQLYMERYYAT